MAKSQYLAAYDVTDDDLRKAVADLLKNNGMERIQYSVFYGELTRNEAEEIGIKFKETTLGHKAQLILLPICETCAKKQIIVNNEGNSPQEEKNSKNTAKNKEKKNKEKEKEKQKQIKKTTQTPPTKNDHSNQCIQQKTKNKTKTRKATSIPLDELKEKKKQKVIFFY